MDQSTIIKLEESVCAHNYMPLPVVLTKAEGVWVWDENGKKYLDMMSAYSAVSHGHHHPKILRAMMNQVDKCAVISRAYYGETLGPFIEKLCKLTGLDRGLPMNTGAEAVETAIKTVRRWGYRIKGIPENKANIIVCNGNFHGRTTTVISFSTEADYRADFGPLTPGFKAIPFGDAKALEEAIDENTCAFLVEPIQGEAGIVVPPEGYLKEVSRICKEKNVMLILDEIQSGLGRTGKMFAYEHEGIRPDGLTLGKALGGGIYPVSVFMAKEELMSVMGPYSHGSTFGGNPLACAIGLEALNILEDENLVQKSAELGDYMMQKLKAIDSPVLSHVRGKGLWIGAVINPDYAKARDVCLKLMDKGILSKETHYTVVRFAPPFIVTKEQIDYTIDQFEKALQTFENEPNQARA